MTTSDVFKALAEDSRREMVSMLSRGPQTATQLAEPFSMSASAVSQHLKVLRDAGLVSVRKAGRYRVYGLETQPLSEVGEWLRELEVSWNERMDRLEGVVAKLMAEREGSDGGE